MLGTPALTRKFQYIPTANDHTNTYYLAWEPSARALDSLGMDNHANSITLRAAIIHRSVLAL
jgi:hypothetical protein